jgi:uncharacterized membrane protein (DUF441 family)
MNFLIRCVFTVLTFVGFDAVNRAHEIVSPLVSGPIAAQQLNDSNAAYIGTQVASQWFNGSGVSPMLSIPLLVLILVWIWYRPVANMFKENV